MSSGEDDGFLQRWSRRKAQVRRGGREPSRRRRRSRRSRPWRRRSPSPCRPPRRPRSTPRRCRRARPATRPAPPPPPPTMDDVAAPDARLRLLALRRRRRRSPTSATRRMKKLFSDPHFNVMDGLDTYIDDYGKPDPIPESMLRQMNQSQAPAACSRSRRTRPRSAAAAAAAGGISRWRGLAGSGTVDPAHPLPRPATDDDPDLRLQPDDAAGRPGPDAGPSGLRRAPGSRRSTRRCAGARPAPSSAPPRAASDAARRLHPGKPALRRAERGDRRRGRRRRAADPLRQHPRDRRLVEGRARGDCRRSRR